MENLTISDQHDSALIRGAGTSEAMGAHGVYEFECYDKDGNLKWKDTVHNTVVNQGKNGMLDSYFHGSPALPAAWYMTLLTANSVNQSSSTYASPGVTEVTTSILAARVAVDFTTVASGGSKSAATTSFTIVSSSATIVGSMLVTATANGSVIANTAGTGGILFSAGNFTGGNKTVSGGDTLNVTYTITV